MEINQWFNGLHLRILGTHEEPAFYASEIARILGIKDTYSSLRNFSQKEIVQKNDRTRLNIITYKIYKNRKPARDDNIILLTEFGVYRLIINSNTQLSEQFRDWVWNVVRELRLRGRYEMKQELTRLQTINEELLEKNNQLQDLVVNLREKQEKIENLTEKIYIIELPNDPTLIKQRHVAESELPEGYETDDDLSSTESDPEDDELIRKNKRLKRIDPEYHNRIHHPEIYFKIFDCAEISKFTYKITDKYDEADKISGTVRWSAFVRDVKITLEKLTEKLAWARLNSQDKYHYYSCELLQIIEAANAVLGNQM